MSQGANVESMLPSWLQLNQNPMNPNGLQKYENNYYQQNVAPGLAAQQAASYNNGQNQGSYAGALQGELQAQGQLSSYNAGLGYAQQLYNDALQGRQSYFAGGPTVAVDQNNAAIQSALNQQSLANQEANIANQYNINNATGQNAYNLSTAQMQNGYNTNVVNTLNNNASNLYGNELTQYGINQNNRANAFSSLFGGLGMLGGAAYGMGSGLLGGGSSGLSTGSGGFTPVTMNGGPPVAPNYTSYGSSGGLGGASTPISYLQGSGVSGSVPFA
jgi:hypothetical protein